MGFEIEVPKIFANLLNLLSSLKFILMMLLFHLGLFDLPNHLDYNQNHYNNQFTISHHQADDDEEGDDDLPILESDLVPSTVMTATMLDEIKKGLPVMEYGDYLQRSGHGEGAHEDEGKEKEGVVCAVCLSGLENEDEVRVLRDYCSHVFHRECLDKWIDQSQVTCPLCRSNLLISSVSGFDHEEAQTQTEERRWLNLNRSGSGGGGRGRGDPWLVERMYYLFGEDLHVIHSHTI